MDHWFYSHAEERFGPYSAGEMRALASSGELLPTDTVFKEGIVRGVVASKVKNLFYLPEAPSVAAVIPAPSAALVEEAPDDLIPSTVPDLLPLESRAAPAESRPTPDRPKPAPDRQAHQRKGRATAGKGVTIVGQDGVNVRFRKKCTTCSHEDYATNSMTIRNGLMGVTFFCSKCRKSRTGEILGSLN